MRSTTPHRTSAQYAARMFTTCVLLPCLALAAIAAVATATTARTVATEQSAAQVCFPASAWSGDDTERPCTTATRPQEDGSGALLLGTVGADRARCVIPNAAEESGRFVIHCKRVGR